MQLRDYQQNIFEKIARAKSNDIIQLDTGAGKTPIIATLAAHVDHVICIAHRNTLIAQMSAHLAEYGVKHATISTKHTRKLCVERALASGLSVGIDENEKNKYVASIDTIAARMRRELFKLDTTLPWLIIIDEAHHIVKNNKWGILAQYLPKARIIGLTATPCRYDGQGLSAKKEGVFDRLVQADGLKVNSTRELIKRGYLCDFRAFAAAYAVNDDKLKLSSSGDYTNQSLVEATKGTINGDVVKQYLALAKDTQALAFHVSIKNAEELADEFIKAGIPSAHIASNMSQNEVAHRLRLFQLKQIKVLVNVEMVGEGVDMPDIQTIILLRKTQSFSMYRQWIGRGLRPAEDKDSTIIIDHVGNIFIHGLPDEHVNWSLTDTIKRQKTNLIDCIECRHIFKSYLKSCPNCGADNPLDMRRLIGGHYVANEIIDIDFCEIKREQIQREELLEREIQWNRAISKGSAVNNLCRQLCEWVVSEAQASSASVRDINHFIYNTRTPEFWITRFTAKDLINRNKSKALRIFSEVNNNKR